MAGTNKGKQGGAGFDTSELRTLQAELIMLGVVTQRYPLEYATGSLQLLFDTPQDIDLLVESLAYELDERAAA